YNFRPRVLSRYSLLIRALSLGGREGEESSSTVSHPCQPILSRCDLIAGKSTPPWPSGKNGGAFFISRGSHPVFAPPPFSPFLSFLFKLTMRWPSARFNSTGSIPAIVMWPVSSTK